MARAGRATEGSMRQPTGGGHVADTRPPAHGGVAMTAT
jgi:hypothetical protein